ncbi:hypothetical protein Hanom_Chr10g00919601 [Helianthus anomalus]
MQFSFLFMGWEALEKQPYQNASLTQTTMSMMAVAFLQTFTSPQTKTTDCCVCNVSFSPIY